MSLPERPPRIGDYRTVSAVVRKGPAFPVSARVQQMNRREIKVHHCYSMTPVNGRRTIARVTNLVKITAMAADKEHEIETLELNPTGGAVCMATCRLPDRMVEEAAAIAAR